jgi:hypothetical protein
VTTIAANVVGRRLRPRYRRLRRVLSGAQPRSATGPTASPSNLSPPIRTSPAPPAGSQLAQASAMAGED